MPELTIVNISKLNQIENLKSSHRKGLVTLKEKKKCISCFLVKPIEPRRQWNDTFNVLLKSQINKRLQTRILYPETISS